MPADVVAGISAVVLKTLFWDQETHLIGPGRIAPKLVCGQFGIDDGDPFILLGDEAVSYIEQHLRSDTRIVTFNGCFDLGVLVAEKPSLVPLVFDKFERGQFYDLMITETLMAIAQGELKFSEDEDGVTTKSRFDLATCYQRRTGRALQKKDTFRLKYGLLDGVPLNEWPAEAVQYALDDVHATRDLYRAELAALGGDLVPDIAPQHRASFALHLMSMWGVRTDEAAALRLREELQITVDKAYEYLRTKTNFLGKVNKKTGRESKSTKAIQAAVTEAYAREGLPVPLTDPSGKFPDGQIKTSKDVLDAVEDPHLKVLSDVMGDSKLLSSFIPVLLQGTKGPLCARYNVLVDSGRTSCSAPNCQNLPRKGGVRECFVARPGYVLSFADYSTLELVCLAQVCLDLFGYSALAEALRKGKDLHLVTAANILNIPYEQAVARKREPEIKEARQLAKALNFGLPGGLGAEKFVKYAKDSYGVSITREEAVELKALFMRTWYEMNDYFKYIKNHIGRSGEATFTQLRSGRVRGGVNFCAAANTLFQGLGSDVSKAAVWAIAKECYCVPSSPLYGSRNWAFVHDETILEIPYDEAHPEKAHAAAMRQSELMVAVKERWLPDVPISAEPVLCRRWYKGAEPVFDENGWLVPSRPEGKGWVRDDDGKLR